MFQQEATSYNSCWHHIYITMTLGLWGNSCDLELAHITCPFIRSSESVHTTSLFVCHLTLDGDFSSTGTSQSWSQHQFLNGLFYYSISEFCVLLTLRCDDHKSSLIQNRGLSAACSSTSRCVLVFLLCIPIGLAEITALPASSLDQFWYYLIRWNDNA